MVIMRRIEEYARASSGLTADAIMAAYDLMSLPIPRLGHGFDDEERGGRGVEGEKEAGAGALRGWEEEA